MESDLLLVFNPGSTSLKAVLFESSTEKVVFAANIDWADGQRQRARGIFSVDGKLQDEVSVDATTEITILKTILKKIPPSLMPKAFVHRVVHAGHDVPLAAFIESSLLERIQKFLPLAPQHNKATLRLIHASLELDPKRQQIAVFDSAFFNSMPEYAAAYAVPFEWYEKGWRRIGFHGISHGWCLERVAEMRGEPVEKFRLINAHLGGGCSVAAIDHSRPVGCTMGTSALEGLPMATRSGSVDPGLLLYLIVSENMSPEELIDILYNRSGLFGLSGISQDITQLLEYAKAGNKRAHLALELFIDRIATAIAGFTARMEGVDAICFTDRIGVSVPFVRMEVCKRLSHLGVIIDPFLNETAKPDTLISAPQSKVEIYVISTQEELYMARQAARLLKST